MIHYITANDARHISNIKIGEEDFFISSIMEDILTMSNIKRHNVVYKKGWCDSYRWIKIKKESTINFLVSLGYEVDIQNELITISWD